MLLSNRLEGFFDLVICVEPYLVDEAVKSFSAELRFDFTEYCLDWVEFRTIPNIKHGSNV